MTPTFFTTRHSLQLAGPSLEGAAAPVAWQSQICSLCLNGRPAGITAFARVVAEQKTRK